MVKNSEHSFFHNLRYSTFAIRSGVSQATVVLTPVLGNVVTLFFTVRPVASLVQDNAYQFTAISYFSILCRRPTYTYLGLFYSRSSYSSETATGNNIIDTLKDRNQMFIVGLSVLIYPKLYKKVYC